MSTLRRRIFGSSDGSSNSTSKPSSNSSSRDESPVPTITDPDNGKDYKVLSARKYAELNEKKAKVVGAKRRHFWVFTLGGLVGVILAGIFAGSNGGFDRLVTFAGLEGMSLDSLIDILPAALIRDVQDLQSREKQAVDYDSFAIGLHARSEGISAKYPVIMIPGVISTGLESWSTEADSQQYFRQRLWGSWTMMKALILDKAAWKRHIMLDANTGLDPPGVKMRAAQGFDAADFFITGYWIWNKILENLATVGYDPTNAFTAAYDWRMTYENYEKRDQYFTRLKNHIELAKQVSNGTKVVLLSHSMGSQVLYYFMHWVEAEGEGFGNGGTSWVADHVDSWINISGCMLGALKDVPAVLSGEMRDTAQLNAFAVYGLEKFLSRHERAEIFRHMPGISSMLPIGGEAVWGNAEHGAPDDQPGQNISYSGFINFKEVNNSITHRNLTVGQSLPYLWNHTEKWYSENIRRSYSQGIARNRESVEKNQKIPAKWINPLETRLPLAPDLKIFCFYGVGKPTERAYFYREDHDATANQSRVAIDTSVSTDDGLVDRGVFMGEGDGTVNLLSTGYMCNKGWKIPRYNPSNISVLAYEMPHEPEFFNPRGGPNTADHVDILGRASLNDLILRVAGGKGHLIEENVVSNIRKYSEKVRINVVDEDDWEEDNNGQTNLPEQQGEGEGHDEVVGQEKDRNIVQGFEVFD